MKHNYTWNRPLRAVRKLAGILTLSAIGALFTTNADAQYCNTATSNDAITVTTVSQNTASYSSGRRAFNFTTVAGRTYTFATCGLTSSDTYLRLYSTGNGGTQLAFNDDGCGTQSTFSYTETVNSTRSILVTRYTSGNPTCTVLNAATRVSYYYTAPAPPAPCFTAPNGEYPTGAQSVVCDGVPHDVSLACGYAGEYTTMNLTSGVLYTFTSSVASDWIASTTVLVPSVTLSVRAGELHPYYFDHLPFLYAHQFWLWCGERLPDPIRAVQRSTCPMRRTDHRTLHYLPRRIRTKW
ncbi:MAG: hypothetical protein IPF95_01650 [Flavobacteriales bacterium]|nr:hypothetical protein [Flavobacteriales bacterium]